jgi:hypothetical protein
VSARDAQASPERYRAFAQEAAEAGDLGRAADFLACELAMREVRGDTSLNEAAAYGEA